MPGSEACHRCEVLLLLGYEPVETGKEEVPVEIVDDGTLSADDAVNLDDLFCTEIPQVISPFL